MKNRKLSLVLCVFFGPFGFHKFYEGDIRAGILYFFTAGIFFFGWIKDIIKYATMKESDYDAEKMREEKKAEKRIKKEERDRRVEKAREQRQEKLRNRTCPKCGGRNFHAFVMEKEIMPEKRIMRHGLNLNPLHPLTFSKTKEKVVRKRVAKSVSKFVCDDCGYIFK